MPKNPKGELSVGEIRELARALNHKLQLKNISKASRSDLIRQIEGKGYRVDHQNKKLVLGRGRVPKAPPEREIKTAKAQRRSNFVKSKAGRGPSKADIITSKVALGTGKRPSVPARAPKKKSPMPVKKKRASYDEI
jgi:lysine/ornithine N-monooxygenase